MSENAQTFSAFIDLVNFDQKIRQDREKLESLRLSIITLEKQKEEYQTALINLKNSLTAKRKQVDAQELAIKELEASVKEKKRVLETTSGLKEYRSLKTEIDYINATEQEQEQELIRSWDDLERAQQECQAKQQEYQEKIQLLEKEIADKRHQSETIEHDAAEYQKGRVEKEQKVPEAWLAKYAVMQSRVIDPVVPIEHDSCSSCFYHVTNVDISGARQGGLVQCKGCYRLLFLPDIMSAH